jgi:protein involved in polysaccharide export with SLBB domain
MAQAAHAGRSDHPLDTTVPRAFRRQLGAVDVPLVEETEAYEIEILDGTTVKRVQSATTTSAIYTAAEQTADWGAPLGPGDTLDISIFQLSALIGRGAAKTVTLQL